MSHISNLRLLFSPLLPTLRSPFSSKRRPYSLLTILSSSSSPHPKRRHLTTPNHLSLNFRSRSKTTSRETRGRDRDEGKSMDESGKENPGFNKKRAEGRDNTKRNLQLKVRKLNPTNTISYVQILGTGMDTQDTSPSVLLFFDKQRFIFNAGEGLQRFCTEHKIKLSKIDHIFLSRVCSETAGGIPGLLLTLAGIGEEGMSVNIWGPSDLKYLVDAMKSFIPHAAMVHTKSFGNDNVRPVDANKIIDPIVLINDEVVKISAILLRPNQSQGSALKPGDMSVIYLCELAEIMGKFDPEKAKALGLKPGPKYRELQSGRSVMSDHQDIMVLPSDVMDPSVPGPIVLLVDCPTESHVQELLSTECLNTYYMDFSGNPTQIGKTVNCIIHLSPASVTRSPTYQKWMKKFGSAQHIMAGHEMKNVEIPILKSSARIAARLNYLCPQFFPAPGFWSLTDLNNSRPDSIFFRRGLCLKAQIINELLSEIPEIVDAAQHVREFWSGPGGLEADINVFQGDKGTGSSQPSKYRNVTSIYINLFSKGSLLLDCGEGTLGQLKRRYGVEGADNAVRKLRCIWISHIHADHHTGLARILALRRDLLKGMTREPILVVGPWQLKKFLDAYQILEDLDMQFIDCRSTTEASWVAFEDDSKSKKG
ncbi:TRNASE Z TRZ4 MITOCHONDRIAL [Salix koriyanagi]|uniref:ribonuclease Z n=1 Tax=Salix koriyanagi TaxID=2511006 RepID=A0A9Q0Q6H7_9ROSI|nr:TRNASE Z TRZ4 MITOCHONDRIAL [Salix koriyanagi]